MALTILFAACGDIHTDRVEVALVPTPAPPAGATLPAALSPALGPPLAWHLELTRQSHETWFYAIARQKAVRRAVRPSVASNHSRAPVPAANHTSETTAVSSGDVWAALARCESGMTNANTGNGFYGYFQFVPSTWRSLGGTGLPTDHSYGEQLALAQQLQARSGWGQWPACSRKLGLR